MSKQTIWNALHELGFSDNATAALMGNWDAESGCESCRLQGDFSADRSRSKAYANTVNNGGGSFITDAQGWGLAQWTYWSRKQGLLNFCKTKGKGIEDENAQVQYAYIELTQQYTAVYKVLMSNTDLYTMTAKVCTDYERPAYNNIDVRYKSAQTILNQYKGTVPTEPTEPTEPTVKTVHVVKYKDKDKYVKAMQCLLQAHGLVLEADGDFGIITKTNLQLFKQTSGIDGDGTTCDEATWLELLC